MSRDEDSYSNDRAKEAKRRLHSGIESSKGLIEQYRARLLAMRAEDELRRGRLLIAAAPPVGRR
jgi:hypothetical protein